MPPKVTLDGSGYPLESAPNRRPMLCAMFRRRFIGSNRSVARLPAWVRHDGPRSEGRTEVSNHAMDGHPSRSVSNAPPRHLRASLAVAVRAVVGACGSDTASPPHPAPLSSWGSGRPTCREDRQQNPSTPTTAVRSATRSAERTGPCRRGRPHSHPPLASPSVLNHEGVAIASAVVLCPRRAHDRERHAHTHRSASSLL